MSRRYGDVLLAKRLDLQTKGCKRCVSVAEHQAPDQRKVMPSLLQMLDHPPASAPFLSPCVLHFPTLGSNARDFFHSPWNNFREGQGGDDLKFLDGLRSIDVCLRCFLLQQ